jgi:hypothetical protein
LVGSNLLRKDSDESQRLFGGIVDLHRSSGGKNLEHIEFYEDETNRNSVFMTRIISNTRLGLFLNLRRLDIATRAKLSLRLSPSLAILVITRSPDIEIHASDAATTILHTLEIDRVG